MSIVFGICIGWLIFAFIFIMINPPKTFIRSFGLAVVYLSLWFMLYLKLQMYSLNVFVVILSTLFVSFSLLSVYSMCRMAAKADEIMTKLGVYDERNR